MLPKLTLFITNMFSSGEPIDLYTALLYRGKEYGGSKVKVKRIR